LFVDECYCKKDLQFGFPVLIASSATHNCKHAGLCHVGSVHDSLYHVSTWTRNPSPLPMIKLTSRYLAQHHYDKAHKTNMYPVECRSSYSTFESISNAHRVSAVYRTKMLPPVISFKHEVPSGGFNAFWRRCIKMEHLGHVATRTWVLRTCYPHYQFHMAGSNPGPVLHGVCLCRSRSVGNNRPGRN
jgi:hypothetical protein